MNRVTPGDYRLLLARNRRLVATLSKIERLLENDDFADGYYPQIEILDLIHAALLNEGTERKA